jgi:hypothetical protein
MKLPNSHYTQTGSEVLHELCRVRFSDCRLVDGSTDCQGQSDLGACLCKMNKEEWNLARRVIINQK